MLLKIIVRACIRFLVRSHLTPKTPPPQSLLMSEWQVVDYQHPKNTPESIIKWHQEYDQSDQPKKLIFSHEGKYLIDLEWIIIEGTWKFSGQNNIDLIDKDNDNLFKMTFDFRPEKHAEFLFTSGEMKDYRITARRQ